MEKNMKAEEFMKEFMEEIDNGLFDEEDQPEDAPDITDEFIEDRIHQYDKLLKSEIIKIQTPSNCYVVAS